MKINFLILLSILSIVILSCDDGVKFDNPNDRNSDAYNPSDTEGETDSDSDETDTISENDDETDNPSEPDNDEPISDDSDSDSTPDGADSIDDSADSVPDESDSDDDSADSVPDDDSDLTDTTPDESDSTPDEDADTDSGDSTPDEDADTDSGDSTPDEDADTDTIPADPCDPNPCSGIANSTGACTVSGTSYSCGCNDGYFWNGSECHKQITLGNICTGQSKYYNNSSEITCPTSSTADFFGQDAQYTNKCTAQSFSSSTNVVIDNNTGLTWEKSPSENTYTWDNASNHCNDLNNSNYGGKSNWRVPNPLEFMTIVDNSTYNPATNSNFTNMPSDSSVRFWTSAEYKRDTSYAYAFQPYYGSYGSDSNSYLKTKTYKVLCVSGEEMQPATSANFTTQTISGKVVVTDSKTGLMWQKEYETDKTWQDALKYCKDLTYAGYSDWRLPNKNELASLINYEKSGAPYSYFPDTLSTSFWSSSTYAPNTSRAWVVYFYSGHVLISNKTNDLNVRCVR